MDNDLLTLWCRAAFLTESEARDLLTELQAARDDAATDEADHEKTIDTLKEERAAATEERDRLRAALDEVREILKREESAS